jgi:hypothetical protein
LSNNIIDEVSVDFSNNNQAISDAITVYDKYGSVICKNVLEQDQEINEVRGALSNLADFYLEAAGIEVESQNLSDKLIALEKLDHKYNLNQ